MHLSLLELTWPGPWAEVVLGVGVAISVLSLLAVPLLIARIPADYFLRLEAPPSPWAHRHRALRWALRGLRMVLGLLLLAAGLAMLVLPGQGLLTLLAGLIVLEFPGKRRLERALLRRERVRRLLNCVRRRSGRAPLMAPRD